MKGDFTRSTFRPKKHYSSVRMQQGRVQLDADWNEQVDIAAHRVESETGDLVGPYGVPFLNPGFVISGGAVPSIGKGLLYLDGMLVENEKDVLVTQQSEFLPNYKPTKTAGEYLAYLDVWQRHVTALEDELIREVALGGPDTATRTQTVWQVRLIGPLTAPLTCSSEPAAWQQLVGFVPGKLRARTAPGTTPATLCEVPAGAGYRRLENQLYRVEIHTPGPRGTAKFKWSRDNGSVVTSWTGQDGKDLIVTSIGRDQVLGFAAGQIVELTDDDRELRGEAGVLVKLSKVEGQVLTLDPSAPAVDRITFGRDPKIRRWDSEGEVLTTANWIALEDGVEVFFEAGCDYKIGDYWMIPARTAKATVEWPADEANPSLPAALVRQGIVHHYCRLAPLHSDGTTFTVTGDCRPKFPPLTMLTSLYCVGGDGQEAMPGNELEQPLEVRVACGGWVLEGATVRFTAEGNGRLATVQGGTGASTVNALDLDTGADGIARCYWKPEANTANPSQQVIALLIDADGNPIKDVHGNLVHVIHFNANLSIAGQVAYESGKCLLSAHTVKEALDQLCGNFTLYYVGGDGQEVKIGGWLPQPLQVRVANGDLPVKDIKVVFKVIEGRGGLVAGEECGAHGVPPGTPKTTVQVITDQSGFAACCWKLDSSTYSQRVSVEIEGAKSPLVYFNATLLTEAADKRCCVTVGKGGDFPALDAALRALLEKQETQVSICLLQDQDEKMTMAAFENDPKWLREPTHVSIRGCAESLVQLQGPLILHGLASFKIRDVNLVVPKFGDKIGFITFDQCEQIAIEHCTLDGESEFGSLLRVIDSRVVSFRDSTFRLQNESGLKAFKAVVKGTLFESYARGAELSTRTRNTMAKNYNAMTRTEKTELSKKILAQLQSGEEIVSEAQRPNYTALVDSIKAAASDFTLVGPALEEVRIKAAAAAGVAIIFDDAEADVVMQNNHVEGGIGVYGVPDKSFKADDLAQMLRSLMKQWKETVRIFPVGGSFHLDGNHLDRIWLGKEMVETIKKLTESGGTLEGLFAEFFAGENVFEALESHICASSLGFHSNHSTTGGENAILAVVLGEVGAFTGNRAIKPNKILFHLGDPPGEGANIRITLVRI
jgi:hypothetical protein